MSKVQLIPYSIGEIKLSANEIPPGVALINAPTLWEAGFKGENIVIAILDTGCDPKHPDLKDRIIGGKNFTSNSKGFGDKNGHGTHVAGTIAASLNGRGLVGVAPQAKLLIGKVLRSNGSGTVQGIVKAIHWAINWRGKKGERVRLINMSLGGPDDVKELHVAIKKAVSKGIAVVCAAGNEGDGKSRTNEFSYPGAYPEVIEVGAANVNKCMAPFSNSNSEVDLAAPGVDILSTYMGSKYAVMSGTSMATPHVSGAIALLLDQKEKKLGRTLKENEIYKELINHTEKACKEDSRLQGNGFLNLAVIRS